MPTGVQKNNGGQVGAGEPWEGKHKALNSGTHGEILRVIRDRGPEVSWASWSSCPTHRFWEAMWLDEMSPAVEPAQGSGAPSSGPHCLLEALLWQGGKRKQNTLQWVGPGPAFQLRAGRLKLFTHIRSEGLSKFCLRGVSCSMPHRILIISNL